VKIKKTVKQWVLRGVIMKIENQISGFKFKYILWRGGGAKNKVKTVFLKNPSMPTVSDFADPPPARSALSDLNLWGYTPLLPF
jgi:hypothetical protein